MRNIYLLVCLSLYLSVGSSSLYARDIEMQETLAKVCEGLYMAKSKTESGEDIYFGLEKIDEINCEGWTNYGRVMTNYLFPGMGVYDTAFAAIGFTPNKEDQESLKKRTGFTDDEFITFKKNIESDFYRVCPHVKSVRVGLAGFDIQKENCYVAYISKKPIVSKFVFPSKWKLSLKEGTEAFQDLLMCLRVKELPDTPVYNNRGIFRNPSSIIEGGYKNISLRLHSFVAHVMHQFFDKAYMQVNAMPFMADTFMKNFRSADFFDDKSLPIGLGVYRSISGPEEKFFLIKTAALIAK